MSRGVGTRGRDTGAGHRAEAPTRARPGGPTGDRSGVSDGPPGVGAGRPVRDAGPVPVVSGAGPASRRTGQDRLGTGSSVARKWRRIGDWSVIRKPYTWSVFLAIFASVSPTWS